MAGGETGCLQTQTNHPAICHSKVQLEFGQ